MNFVLVDRPDDLVPRLLELCPGSDTLWRDHLEWWKGEANRGVYNDLAVIAEFVVECTINKRTDFFPRLFEFVESALAHGDAELRGRVVWGLLEDIQTIASNRLADPDLFLSWLGPLGREAWAAIYKAWEGKTSLADVVRTEHAQKNRRNT